MTSCPTAKCSAFSSFLHLPSLCRRLRSPQQMWIWAKLSAGIGKLQIEGPPLGTRWPSLVDVPAAGSAGVAAVLADLCMENFPALTPRKLLGDHSTMNGRRVKSADNVSEWFRCQLLSSKVLGLVIKRVLYCIPQCCWWRGGFAIESYLAILDERLIVVFGLNLRLEMGKGDVIDLALRSLFYFFHRTASRATKYTALTEREEKKKLSVRAWRKLYIRRFDIEIYIKRVCKGVLDI